MDFIDLKSQYKALELGINRRINDVLRHGHYILGPEVDELELKLAEYVGAKYCVSCANGTDALVLSLMALGVGPGDEVVTTAFSFFATAEAICLVGAKPVFVDIDSKNFNIDASLIENEINERTKAIIAVSLFGQLADLENVNRIAKKYKIPVIEDAAQSFGAQSPSGYSCAQSIVATTSFFPAKPLGCYGDGGACFTNSKELAELLRSLRVHGKGKDKYDNLRIGMNSRLDTLQAAILLEKLEHYRLEIENRQVVAAMYSELLPEGVETPFVNDGHLSVWAQYCILTDKRDDLRRHLSNNLIPTAIYYDKPLYRHPVFLESHSEVVAPTAERVSKRILGLPMHPYLNREQVSLIADKIKDVV